MPTDALFALGMLKFTSRMFASQQDAAGVRGSAVV